METGRAIPFKLDVLKAGIAVQQTPSPEPVPVGSLWTGKRRYIALFLFANLFINYTNRVALSVAAPIIAKQFNWSAAKMGLLFSSFLWTYWICLIPWGALSDRLGSRRVSTVSVTLWSVAAML